MPARPLQMIERRLPVIPVGAAVCLGLVLVATGNWLAGLWTAFAGACVSLFIAWRRSQRLGQAVAHLETKLQDAGKRDPYRDAETGLRSEALLRQEWSTQLARYQRRGERFVLTVLAVARLEQMDAPLGKTTSEGVARILREVAREEDQVYRLDDGRFAILLPGTEREGAERFVGRAARVLMSRTTNLLSAEESDPLTVSSTIVEWRDDLDLALGGESERSAPRRMERWSGQRSSQSLQRVRRDFPEQRAS